MILCLMATLLIAPTTVSAKENFNVVFLGGSITEAGNGYAGRVGKWLGEWLPDKTVNVHNAGLGGTPSSIGMMRLGKDVLSYAPDLVFIEFAVNDTDLTANDAKRYTDGIVWVLEHQEKVPAIVFLYTTKQSGTSFASAKATHQQVANYYGLPSIDMGQALIDAIAGGTAANELFQDGVHPTIKGHEIYTESVKDSISKNPDRYLLPHPVKDKPLEAANKNLSYPTELSVQSSRLVRTGAWQVDGENLITNEKGASLKLDFYGSYFGLMYMMNQNVGSVTYSIDGGAAKTVNTAYSINYYQKVGQIAETNLPEGAHTVIITSAEGKEVRLAGILLDEGNGPQTEEAEKIVASVKTVGGAKVAAGESISADAKGLFIRFSYPMNASSVNAESIEVSVGDKAVPARVTLMGQTAKIEFSEKLPEGKGKLRIKNLKTAKGSAYSGEISFHVSLSATDRVRDSLGEFGRLPQSRKMTVTLDSGTGYDALVFAVKNALGQVVYADYQSGGENARSFSFTTPEATRGMTLHGYEVKDGVTVEIPVRSVRNAE